MALYVLDTSALLTALYAEPGKERVDNHLIEAACLVGAVNLAEFASKCADAGMAYKEIESIVQALDIEVAALTPEQAYATGLLRPQTRHLGLSLGDRACLALAKSRDAVALTADRAWLGLDIGVKIECVRPE
jgi:ribonuclease VapC